MLLVNSKKGKNNFYIGFRKEDSENGSKDSKNGSKDSKNGGQDSKNGSKNSEMFESMLYGIIPGKRIKYDENFKFSDLTKEFEYGGLVTGVPTLKKEDENQKFNLSSIIRSLYGKDYTLAILSKPIIDIDKKKSYGELISIRDDMHAISKRTIGEERGTGITDSTNKQISEGVSNTEGNTYGMSGGVPGAIVGATVGGSFGAVLGFIIGNTVNYSKNESRTNSTTITKGEAITNSTQQSKSISIEQQNGLAIELEKIADQYLKRITKGFNSGLWETTISFAAKDKISCEILGGTFIGELSKPNESLLPPPRLYLNSLRDGKGLLLPKVNNNNPIFPKSLASYISSEELAFISSPPTESVSGYEVKKMPSLALNDLSDGEFKLGNISDYGNPIENSFFSLSKKDLNKHLFVCGLTGSGKTTTVKNILKKLSKESIPFLVLESAKRDYRQLLADEEFKEDKLNIFTIGDATISPIRFNPFYIQKGVHPIVHIDYLKAIFNASFSLYGPMPHILEKCLHNIYLKRGWNMTDGTHPNFFNDKGKYDEDKYNLPEHFYFYPTLSDLKDEVDNYVKYELEYKGELQDNIRTAIVARLESLCVGAKGLMFNTYDFYPIEELLKINTIFEMENLVDDDDKAFFVGLILVLISEYRQKDNPAINPGREEKGLQHFLVIEEAHRLLKNVTTERHSEMMGNPKGKAVEVFCNVISEMRSLGQGVAVVEQIPTKISPDVIKNSNTKIVHRLVAKDDQSLLAGSLSISDEDALYLNRLVTGHALCHKEGMERPVECLIKDDVESLAISNEKVYKIMREKNIRSLHNSQTYELAELLGKKGKELIVKLLNSLLTIEYSGIKKLIDYAKSQLRKLIILKNIRTQYNDSILLDYFVKQIFELVNKGVYCKTFKLPKDIKKNVSDLFISQTETLYKAVFNGFNEIWETKNPANYIKEVVENLVIKYIFNVKKELSDEDTKSAVSSYFLLTDSNTQIINEITKEVILLTKGEI